MELKEREGRNREVGRKEKGGGRGEEGEGRRERGGRRREEGEGRREKGGGRGEGGGRRMRERGGELHCMHLLLQEQQSLAASCHN